MCNFGGFFTIITAPGNFLKTVELILVFMMGTFILFDSVLELTKKFNWIIPQIVYGILCSASFYLARRVDPREPSPSRKANTNRIIAFGSIVFCFAVLEWTMRNVVKDMSFYAYVGHVLAFNTALYVRGINVFFMLYKEIPDSVQRKWCFELWAELGVYVLTFSLCLVHIRLPGSNYEIVLFLLVRTILFYSSISFAHVVAGKYRTVARRPDEGVQFVLNIVVV